MDIFQSIEEHPGIVRTVELHTSGEPIRIIISGFPKLQGNTLLENRRYASENHEVDRVRKWLMLEPRRHQGMYGAILVKETELTRSGEADIEVLFCHNEGYSTMCGHATIALGRFLVDTQDVEIFPRRALLQLHKNNVDGEIITVLRLHTPCGVVTVTVPTTPQNKSDGSKPVRFRYVPCFVASPLEQGITIEVPMQMAWPKLIQRGNQQQIQVRVDISYGGAFYALVSSEELGFTSLQSSDAELFKELADAARILRILLLNQDPQIRKSLVHPEEPDIGFLYGITILDSSITPNLHLKKNLITWICFFADEQIDRSPTGSCVSAHIPLALDQNQLEMGQWCSYQSFLSTQFPGNEFRGRAIERNTKGYVIELEGFAHYTGTASFVPPQEKIDTMGSGFVLKLPSNM
ncbi:putative proline racemase [Lentinula aciculospora]|uniref:trans-L-3-hydroxyproline dehydratase n=1 Tax=Lentinula aciculospora TaxID=153920 RepID=A0A9W9DMY6_9AGAR|nr:putative proline racemase [Lentinula aciculospora]